MTEPLFCPPWKPYRGDAYWEWSEIQAWCRAAAAHFPDWVSLRSYGVSREGQALLVLTLHLGPEPAESCSAFWLDGGTHASEWTGVMSTLFTLSRWLEGLEAGDAEVRSYFTRHTAYIVPCISPDGFQHLMEGGPMLRSTRRPSSSLFRPGLEPQDVNGDGRVAWMRWRHPAGPWVQDEALPMLMRPRTLTDSPENAWYVCAEGLFTGLDPLPAVLEDAPTQPPLNGAEVAASARFGLDLNRNFPAHWTPFGQFGMDGGEFPLSEPESRAVTLLMASHPNVCAVLTLHTYTGAILTSPYRPDHGLPSWDLETLYRLAQSCVEGTGYRIFKTHPEFQYEAGQNIPGVWADYLVSVRGTVAYTLELWDPYGHAGVELKDPAKSFFRPDLDAIRTMVRSFIQEDGSYTPWTPFIHPQLGPVELGGFNEQRTVRNPPVRLLPAELERGFKVADTLRRALPEPCVSLAFEPFPPGADLDSGASAERLWRLIVRVDNRGYLGTWSLSHAARANLIPAPTLEISCSPGLDVLEGPEVWIAPQLPGWGDAPQAFRMSPLHPVLPAQSPSTSRSWILRGSGSCTVTWSHARSGTVSATVSIPATVSGPSAPGEAS